MREEFLDLREGDKAGLLEFLNKWGWWRNLEFHMRQMSDGRNQVAILEPAAPIWGMRRSLRKAMLGAHGNWLRDENSNLLPFLMRPRSGFPLYALGFKECEVAIRATITIDFLYETKFRACARPDCPKTYQVRSKHPRKFCSQYCGHLVSQRRKRSEAGRQAKKQTARMLANTHE